MRIRNAIHSNTSGKIPQKNLLYYRVHENVSMANVYTNNNHIRELHRFTQSYTYTKHLPSKQVRHFSSLIKHKTRPNDRLSAVIQRE